MADQAERVILEAEDQVTPITDKANAALDGFEKKAESSHGKVIRISDQTRSSVQRLIASLEKQAETYGKSGVDRLITQRDQLLQRYNREPQAIDAITRSYEKMIAMEEKAAREALAVKAAKEAEEALRKQSEAITSFGDRVSQFMENPLQGAKGALSSVLTALGPFGVAVTGGYSPAPWAAGGGDWSGASAGTPTLNRVPGGTGGFNPLAMLFGGARGGAAGGSGPSGLAGIVSNLKRTNWGSFNRSPSNPTYGTDENGNDVQTAQTGR